MAWWRPKEVLTEIDVERGLKLMVYDGMCSQVMGVLTGGAFLVAFALHMGASNKVIGLIAALGPLTQILQIPAIYIVDWLKRRKLVATGNAFAGRLFLLAIAGIPWFVPATYRIWALVISLSMYYGLGSIGGVAWNSWMRDLVPEKQMGSYFGRRLAIATALGAALSLAAGVGVDLYKRHVENEVGVYALLFIIGAGFGLVGTIFLSRCPEPQMHRTIQGYLRP